MVGSKIEVQKQKCNQGTPDYNAGTRSIGILRSGVLHDRTLNCHKNNPAGSSIFISLPVNSNEVIVPIAKMAVGRS